MELRFGMLQELAELRAQMHALAVEQRYIKETLALIHEGLFGFLPTVDEDPTVDEVWMTEGQFERFSQRVARERVVASAATSEEQTA